MQSAVFVGIAIVIASLAISWRFVFRHEPRKQLPHPEGAVAGDDQDCGF